MTNPEPNPVTDAIKALYAAAELPMCPFCDADSELVELEPNVLILEIRHDDDCPELTRRTKEPR
jgi:hypothetical protein